MKIKFYNLNIKHKYHFFDSKNLDKSAAEYWLNDKKQAPIFYGDDSCEAILNGSSRLEKKYHRTVNSFLTVTSNKNFRPIFITLDSGWLWIYEPLGEPKNGNLFSFRRTGKSTDEADLPKYYDIKMLLDKCPISISEIPYILATIKSSQAFAQGTFYPIGENIDGKLASRYDGNIAAIKVLLRNVDFVADEYAKLLIDPLHCLSSVEFETLVAKIFEAYDCFVPAYRGGVLKDIDLFVDTPDATKIAGITVQGNDRLSIQIKLNTPKNKIEINRLCKFLDSSEKHYLITLEEEYHSDLEYYKRKGQYLTADWVRDQISRNQSVQKWFDKSLEWLPSLARI